MEMLEEKKTSRLSFGSDYNALTWLVILIAIGFLTINSVKIVMFMSYADVKATNMYFHQTILPYFSLSPDLSYVGHHPWTLLLYMFSHEGVMSVLGTLIWLWGFGYLLQDLAGNKHLFPLFIYGGLAGALIFLISSNAIHNFANGMLIPMLGSGASVMAIAVAVTTLAPNYRILPMLNGGIPLWVIMVIFIAIDYATIATTNGSFALAHLAGGLVGFFYINALKKGKDWGAWMSRAFNWTNDLFNPEKKIIRENKEQFYYKVEKDPYKVFPRKSQDRVDELLDKINKTGFESLTEEEKAFLKKMSED